MCRNVSGNTAENGGNTLTKHSSLQHNQANRVSTIYLYNAVLTWSGIGEMKDL